MQQPQRISGQGSLFQRTSQGPPPLASTHLPSAHMGFPTTHALGVKTLAFTLSYPAACHAQFTQVLCPGRCS